MKGLSFPCSVRSFRDGVDSNRKGLKDWENGGQELYIGIMGNIPK